MHPQVKLAQQLNEPLVHQWFVELLRKFNLWVHIFDEERCAAIEKGLPEANPFLDDQVILCSIDFLAAHPERAEQAKEASLACSARSGWAARKSMLHRIT